MSSTNKTTNYELSQFLGTDKPAWLSDYNTDMSKIDAQMKLNADAATTANGGVTTNATNIGTLTNLTTDAKTSAVAAINEVDSHADSAATTASSALSASTTNATAIQNLTAYLNLSVNNDYTGSQFTVTSGTGSIVSANHIYVARNAAGTLGKIYGTLQVDNATAGTTTVKLNIDTGLTPTEAITIVGDGVFSSANGDLANANLKLNTDGTIEISGYHGAGTFFIRMFACLLFIQNFGDSPE